MSARAKTSKAAARASRTIPATLHSVVAERLSALDPSTGKPHTSRAVAAWLKDAHGIECSHHVVLRVAASVDAKHEARVIAALREELRDAVAPALTRLRRASKRLSHLASTSKSVKDLAAATNALTRALHEVAHLGGVASPITVDVTSNGKPLQVYVPAEDKLP